MKGSPEGKALSPDTKYGIPYLFKTDKRTVFEYNKKGTTLDEDNTFTQFAYASAQLGTSIETSSTPEFKPRIERLFGTLQTRLVSELRLAGITTIEEANNFLPTFLDKYNSKFALCIDNTKSVFEKQPSLQKINLTLAVLSRRTIDTGHSICFKKKFYRPVNCVNTPIYFGKGTKCMVIEAFDKSLYVTIEDSIFALEEIPEVQSYSESFDKVLPKEPKGSSPLPSLQPLLDTVLKLLSCFPSFREGLSYFLLGFPFEY